MGEPYSEILEKRGSCRGWDRGAVLQSSGEAFRSCHQRGHLWVRRLR
jgi:hypothetical protein